MKWLRAQLAAEGGAIRVGSRTRPHREGEAVLFDSSFEHEAWSRAGRDRVVLLIDLWRPDLAAREVAGLQLLHPVAMGVMGSFTG